MVFGLVSRSCIVVAQAEGAVLEQVHLSCIVVVLGGNLAPEPVSNFENDLKLAFLLARTRTRGLMPAGTKHLVAGSWQKRDAEVSLDVHCLIGRRRYSTQS